MTQPAALTQCSHDCCPIHPEFSKRLDDRWDSHLETHDRERNEICKKFDSVFERFDKLNIKVSVMMGGAFGIGFVIGLLVEMIKK